MKGWLFASLVAVMLAVVVVGCAGSPAPAESPAMESAGEPGYDMAEEAPREVSYGSNEYGSVERLIVRQASLDVVVPDTEAALEEIAALARELDGYIIDSSMVRYEDGVQASITLRVPADNLDAALQRIRGLATEVRHETVSGQDVTEEYVDLQSRLRHLQATEERLLTFLDEAEDTEAALAVYEQLRGVQAEMEQVKGRIQYLEQSAAMSSVTVSLTPDEMAQPIQVAGWHPEGTLRNAVEALVRVLQFLVDAVIVIAVLIAPVLAVIAAPIVGVFFAVRALVRRRRARKSS